MSSLCFPIVKYSWAAVVEGTREVEIPWKHISEPRMAVYLHSDTFGAKSSQLANGLVMRVLHEDKVLEQISITKLCRAVQENATKFRSHMAGSSYTGSLVSAIVRSPCIALKYRCGDNQVRRLQVKMQDEKDFDIVLRHLETAKCPITVSVERLPQKVATQPDSNGESLSSTSLSIGPIRQVSKTIPTSSRRPGALQDVPGHIMQVSSVTGHSPVQGIANPMYNRYHGVANPSPRASSQHSSALPQGVQSNEATPFPTQIAMTTASSEQTQSWCDSRSILPSHRSEHTSLGRGQPHHSSLWSDDFRPRMYQSIGNHEEVSSQRRLGQADSMTRVDNEQAPPRPITAPWSDHSDSTMSFLPPKRDLPFDKRPHSSRIESEMQHDANACRPGSALNLPPLPVPTFTSDLIRASRLAPASEASLRRSDTLALDYTQRPDINQDGNPRSALRLIEGNSVRLSSSNVPNKAISVDSRVNIPIANPSNAEILEEDLDPRHLQHHQARTPTTSQGIASSSHGGRQGSDLEKNGELLHAFATQPLTTRQAALDAMICNCINNDDFLTLCQDLENSWKRIGLDVGNSKE